MSNTNTSTPPGADNTGALAPAPPQPPAVVTTAQQQQLQVPDAFNNANALAADRKKWGGLQPALYERVAIFPKQDADVNNTDSKLAYSRVLIGDVLVVDDDPSLGVEALLEVVIVDVLGIIRPNQPLHGLVHPPLDDIEVLVH